MLSTLLQFIGLTPTQMPKRPPSARGVAPNARKRVAPPVAPVAPLSREELVASVARQAAQDARNAIVHAERQSAIVDARFADAVRLILRANDRSSERYFDARDVEAAEACIGEAVAEFMRACRYAGVRLPPVGEAMTAIRLAAYRADLGSRAVTDFDTWERGNAALAKAQVDAKRHGETVPPALLMPAEVAAGIARLVQERIDRLARRSGGRAGTVTGTGTETATATTTDSSTVPPSTTDSTTSDDEPETYTPPGSKR